MDRLLDSDDLINFLDLTRSGLYKLRSRGEAPPAIRVGGTLRWRVADVERWLDANSEEPS